MWVDGAGVLVGATACMPGIPITGTLYMVVYEFDEVIVI
jgi:hypothetical protein